MLQMLLSTCAICTGSKLVTWLSADSTLVVVHQVLQGLLISILPWYMVI